MIQGLGAVLATSLAAALVFLQPIAGRRRYERLLAALETDSGARLRHYKRGMAGEWAAVGIVAVIGLLTDRGWASIGLTTPPNRARAVSEVAGVAVILALTAVVFRFGGPAVLEAVRRQARGFLALLPRTRVERWAFVGLAVTAGFCEEILFRGFGIAYVRWLWPSATRSAIVTLTSIGFGLAHAYQGPRGVLLTGLVGAGLASVTLSTGSLFPAIVMHALLDLRILAVPQVDIPDLPPVSEGG